MQTAKLLEENDIAAGVAELRTRYTRTQDLYREVCILLFFRHGVTPTVNMLYQLVRKGSMSAPTAALREFWSTLRERSRVSVEHADLPDELRAVAGDMLAALWRSAQAASNDALATSEAESAAKVEAAKLAERRAEEAHAAVLIELQDIQVTCRQDRELIDRLKQELSGAAAATAVLKAQLDHLQNQLGASESRISEQDAAHLAEREKLSERIVLAEKRFTEMEKRTMLDIDRERTTAAKVHKRIEAERQAATSALNDLRIVNDTAQNTINQLREKISSLQGSLKTLDSERNREREELTSVRAELQKAVANAAAESTRADAIHAELARQKAKADTRQQRPGRPNVVGKRKR